MLTCDRKAHITLHCLQWMNTECVTLLVVYIFHFSPVTYEYKSQPRTLCLSLYFKNRCFKDASFQYIWRKQVRKERDTSLGEFHLEFIHYKMPGSPIFHQSVSLLVVPWQGDPSESKQDSWDRAFTACLIETALLPVWDSYKYDC